ncbi:Glutathione S-transferase lancl1 [Goodea atripinnis]|uniref:Glutathione S-transferase LANCL1 n=1 Tax=Goodea atripinnis TaxID=208336 RepID=A0ABV0P0F0_9TELE
MQSKNHLIRALVSCIRKGKPQRDAWKHEGFAFAAHYLNLSSLFLQLTPEFAQRLSSTISELLAVMENGLMSADPRDCTAYTGWAEVSFLQKALEYVSRSLKCLTRRHDVTFLCGDAGPLAVAAVVYSRLQRAQEAEECISSLVRTGSRCSTSSRWMLIKSICSDLFLPNFLFHKCLYFFSIQISEAVLASGEHLSRKFRVQNQSPLMYEWYQEQYVGAAHGLAGIYYFLMQVGHKLVKPSVDHVCRLRFPSGNYPPCMGDDRDLLVHWCHGSPGVIYMLLQAYKVFGIPQYLEDALQCGEVVWRWGLLKKGYGLCHGAAGNAYSFLGLYRLTQDPKHLYRACMVRAHGGWGLFYDPRPAGNLGSCRGVRHVVTVPETLEKREHRRNRTPPAGLEVKIELICAEGVATKTRLLLPGTHSYKCPPTLFF